MRNYQSPISDEKIIELYNNGWSQKSIIDKYGVAVSYLRRVLKNADFLTSSYRAISDDTKDVIIAFIYAGISIQQIANYIDISFYAIREVLEKNNLQGISMQVRLENSNDPLPIVDEEIFEQVKGLFIKGEVGLVKICDILSIAPEEIVKYAVHLNPFIKTHKRNMKSYILSQFYNELPISAISKQMCISRSIVKQVISDHID